MALMDREAAVAQPEGAPGRTEESGAECFDGPHATALQDTPKRAEEGIASADTESEEDADFVKNSTSSDSDGAIVSSGNFRARYIRRLVDQKVFVPAAQRPPKHQTVIIFDWDDTLLCTTWLNQVGMSADSATEAHLEGIAGHVLKMLTAAQSMGQVFIITNAMTGWVEYSAQRWAPQLAAELRNIPIISARDRYEPMHPRAVDMWKVEAFLEVQRKLPPTQVTNLVALGDSDFEMKAAAQMGSQFENALLKTVKFREHPTPVVLLKQLELVSRNLGKIVSTSRNLKIFLEKRSAP